MQLSQPLSQQYKIGLNIRQSQLAKLADEQRLRSQKHAVFNQVKKAYYAVMQTQSSLAASEENLKFDHELERTTEQLVTEKAAEIGQHECQGANGPGGIQHIDP